MSEEREKLEGYVCAALGIESLVLTGDFMASILGTDAEHIKNKGDWARNPKTGRKIRRYENSFWCRYFQEREGDFFSDAMGDAITFLKDNEAKINHLKELDEELDMGIELVIKKGDFHIGGAFLKDHLLYLAENNIEFGLNIYQMIGKDSFG